MALSPARTNQRYRVVFISPVRASFLGGIFLRDLERRGREYRPLRKTGQEILRLRNIASNEKNRKPRRVHTGVF
jgi:hypothetical protein